MDEKDYLSCCGSSQFAKEMLLSSPFLNLDQALQAARHIWFNKVDVNGWLEAFAAHPQIGAFAAHPQIGAFAAHPQIGDTSSSSNQKTETSAKWSRGEQSTALATATHSSLQELLEWNAQYRQKFGFVFLICASGRSTLEILTELKKRYSNRPIVEFEIAAQEQMKITELRLAKLFEAKASSSIISECPVSIATKAGEDRVSVIGGHVTASSEHPSNKVSQAPSRSRPPITTHVLDVSRGSPAVGIEVQLEKWKGAQPRPTFPEPQSGGWVFQGSSVTNTDGRSGQLMGIVDNVDPGIYRISFNTGKYSPNGFFPYVSIVFEIRESQRSEHFHVPLLLSPFSFSTYRGS